MVGFLRVGSTVALTIMLAGCGVVYTPQSFSVPSAGYGFHRTDSHEIEVLPLTFASAQLANADGYQPRRLPNIFSQTELTDTASFQSKLAASGLTQIEPALVLNAQNNPPLAYDPTQEILPPALRNEQYSAAPVVDAVGGQISTSIEALAAQRRVNRNVRSIDSLLQDAPQLEGSIRPLTVRYDPPPIIEAQPYRIGTGDVLALLSKLESIASIEALSNSVASELTKQLLVQENGDIYIPQVGAVTVGGLTLDSARQEIFNRLLDSQLDFDFGIEIIKFGSQAVSVHTPNGATLIPISIPPLTLGSAIVAAGGIGNDSQNLVIRMMRSGRIYEIPVARFLQNDKLATRILQDGDAIYISPIYDLEKALLYFENQTKNRELQQSALQEAREGVIFENGNRQAAIDEIQAQIAFETYKIEAERLRQTAILERFKAQLDAETSTETARIANIQARQTYLNQLRNLQRQNREAALQYERAQREILIQNANERQRERQDRLRLFELELTQERHRINQLSIQQREIRENFNKRLELGAIEQDYVYITGEANKQASLTLPFETTVSLSHALYNAGEGINPLTGNSGEIYVFRRPTQGAVNEKLSVYHLDASRAENLSVATLFQMRPNDVVFINPQPVTNWNRVVQQLLPSLNAGGSLSALPIRFN